tara:strand:- start:926 stop:1321 length:396 start_codon:yes stop_codon:yes gene_type:complete
MAFTRNKFTREDYQVEQCEYRKRYEYNTDKLGFVLNDSSPSLNPGFGVYAMTNVPKDFMARNAVDVESDLRGIRANDFVRGEKSPTVPDYRSGHGTEKIVQFFQRPNAFSTISPIPCVNPKYQEKERPVFY